MFCDIYICIKIDIYINTYMYTNTHTHTHYIYIYIYVLIRWPINRFNRFCDFLRFNRFNRFIEINKSIFSKFWKLTNFRFWKNFSFQNLFVTNSILWTADWKPLIGRPGFELSSQRRDGACTNHKTTLSDPAPSDRLYTQPSFSWIYWAFFLMGPHHKAE